MTRIWKYRLSLEAEQTINVPDEPVVLRVALDPQGHPSVWMLVDDRRPKRDMLVSLLGTGWGVDDKLFSALREKYWGTVVHEGYVWHYFGGYAP